MIVRTHRVEVIARCNCDRCSSMEVGMSYGAGRIFLGTIVDMTDNCFYLIPATKWEQIKHYINTFIPGKVEYLS